MKLNSTLEVVFFVAYRDSESSTMTNDMRGIELFDGTNIYGSGTTSSSSYNFHIMLMKATDGSLSKAFKTPYDSGRTAHAFKASMDIDSTYLYVTAVMGFPSVSKAEAFIARIGLSTMTLVPGTIELNLPTDNGGVIFIETGIFPS